MDQCQAEAERIAASEAFQRAPVMRRLLRFLVTETLAGRGDGLKAYGVAVDGLGRDPDFDPQADSYPRVQVGRLRRMIASFYMNHGPGAGDIRLDIPSGGYRVFWSSQPVDRLAPPADPAPLVHDDRPTPWFRRPLTVAVAALLAVLLIGGVWISQRPPQRQAQEQTARGTSVAAPTPAKLVPSPVIDLAAITPVEDADPVLARRVDRIMGDALHRSWALSVRAATDDPDRKADDLAARRSHYRLTGTLVGKDRPLLYLNLWHGTEGTKLWSQRIDLERGASIREALGPTFAALMSPFGIIATRERRALDGNFAPGFPCMMRYAEYYTANRSEMTAPVRRCLRETLARDPGFSPALSAEIILRLRDAIGDPAQADAARRDALSLARRAVDADPYSAEAAMAMAVAAYANEMCDLGRASAMRALDRNPYNSHAHAQTGLFLFQCGDPDYVETLERAWRLDSGLPAITAMPLLVSMGDRGDGAAALRFARSLPVAEGYRRPGYELTMAVAHAAAGDRTAARASWAAAMRAIRVTADTPPDAVLRRIVLTPQLASRTEAYLRARGVFG
ncbi:hypothetical protein [Sphingobium algorifonticola]|uniref:Tetratricopeptide repeat protein n=1 Tax=Sphingobium algorifonticola TaxID=2008318 RepID=A0A437J8C0_9SPHN|nr:hypothetical protein [Sphingobium algorifonticola]RVT41748.1 hypothetical protein ENE74_05555 [Sphingobium algorifonticola]